MADHANSSINAAHSPIARYRCAILGIFALQATSWTKRRLWGWVTGTLIFPPVWVPA